MKNMYLLSSHEWIGYNEGVDQANEAYHLCTQMRGVHEVAPLTRTTLWRGEYESNAALRTEFFDMYGVRA